MVIGLPVWSSQVFQRPIGDVADCAAATVEAASSGRASSENNSLDVLRIDQSPSGLVLILPRPRRGSGLYIASDGVRKSSGPDRSAGNLAREAGWPACLRFGIPPRSLKYAIALRAFWNCCERF